MYYPQINVRTSYNFLESLISIEQYIDFALKHKFKYLFYAEHNSMHGIADFFVKAKKANIKPIIGIHIDILESNLWIYAKNEKGFENISLISSFIKSNIQQDNLLEIIKQNTNDNNVIIFQTFDNKEEIEKLFDHISDVNFYDSFEHSIITDVVNYLDEKDEKIFQILIAIKFNLKYHEMANHIDLKTWYQTEDEENSSLKSIAESIDFNLFSKKAMNIAKFTTPDNIPSYSYLEQKCKLSLQNYFINVKKQPIDTTYIERLNYELSVIKAMNFADYFLVVADYVNYAKKNNIMVGPGRGSAAGSLVSFLLKITEINPIDYGLLFERFLNPARSTMPDIDVDFEDERREEILEYLFEKYGKDKVATIVTYQTIGFKQALRDVGRVLEIDNKIIDLISKSIPFSASFEEAKINNEILDLYLKDEEYDLMFQAIKNIIGLPRQIGTHAAGIIIANSPIANIAPIQMGVLGIKQTQWDMKYIEDFGLIKMDLLGLRNLTILKQIMYLVEQKEQKQVRTNKIPINDQRTYQILNRGETSGIFQLESQGMIKTIKDIQVNSIEDISVCSALFRPGPQEMIPTYINNKRKNKFVLIDSSLKDILSSTYGIIIYQEQVIQILQRVANFSLAKSDLVRRAIGKKDQIQMLTLEKEFIESTIANGYQLATANKIWEWISKFANYGFNKSHSISYAFIGYWLAFFKTHYPEEFYAVLLNNVINSTHKTKQYIHELSSYGVKVLKPSIQYLGFDYKIESKILQMPLTLIKNIGPEFIKQLQSQAELHPEMYQNIYQFVAIMRKHGLNNQTFNALAGADALSLFGYSWNVLLDNCDHIFKIAENINFIDVNNINELHEINQLEFDKGARFEKELFGFYISSHPISKLKNEFSIHKPIDIFKIKQINEGNYNVIAIISKMRIIKDKNNREMAFVEIGDETDSIDVTIFASTFSKYQGDLRIGNAYVLKVKVDKYGNDIKLILDKVIDAIKIE